MVEEYKAFYAIHDIVLEQFYAEYKRRLRFIKDIR